MNFLILILLKGGNKMTFDFRKYEEKLTESLNEIFETIICKNTTLNISAKSRAGAEVSDYLEDEFVEYVNHTVKHPLISDALGSPKGSTKNPFDALCYFNFMDRTEKIWIDVKAFKISSEDSNPDSGTIKKVIKFIKEGNFYIVFVYVYYDEAGTKTQFVKFKDKYTKTFLLKDVDKSVRVTPSNQLQVNMDTNTQYRTREEFIHFLKQKHLESLNRTILKKSKELKELDDVYEELITKQ
jgi:hypothetical protein